MKRITMVGLFVGMLSLTMNAQFIQSSSSDSRVRTTDVQNQSRPDTSIQELLARYQSLGKQAGSISEFFTKKEQSALRTYFSEQKSVNTTTVNGKINRDNSDLSKQLIISEKDKSAYLYENLRKATNVWAGASRDNSDLSRQLTISEDELAVYDANLRKASDDNPRANRNNSDLARELIAPVAERYPINEEDNQAEILAHREYQRNNLLESLPSLFVGNRPMSDIIPTAGAIESFSPSVGDHFFDPGGPGGSSTGGTPGNYPNCGCDTQTTLLGVSEINFLYFSVFSTFDYLRIYDGTDATGIKLYDNSAGPNSGDITLADMIDSHGSSTFTSTSGNFFFFFHASTVVDYGGWDAEIISASGGGGEGTTCSQSHPFSTPGGASGSSVDSDFKTASDIVVAAGENFTIETIEVPFLTFAPLDTPTTANVVYYADNAGFPGTMIGSETVVPTIISSEPWANPVAFQFKTSLTMTPFTFMGDASVAKKYWIEISMGTATNQATVFWEYTDDIAVEGLPMVQFDASVGTWSIPDPVREVIYTYNGQCEDIGGGGDPVCSQSHPFSTPGGASGSSVDSDFKTASDIVVAAGENFTIETIEVPFLTFAPLDTPTTANVVYYSDNAGFPGTMIGSETVVPTIISSEPWANPVAFQFKTSLTMTPFTFMGDASVAKKYWIEISMGTATNQATVFWEYTDDIAVEGLPMVQFDASVGTWSVPDPVREVIYTYSGQCEDIGGGGDPVCSQTHPFSTPGGASGSSVDSDFKTASDIVVAAGENFTIDTIEVPFLTFAPLDTPTTANVVYYADNAGFPGTMIGSETVVPTIISSEPWANPVAFQFKTSLTMTPFTFMGDASVAKKYWIEISMGTATNQATVFWEYTDDIPVEGLPMVQFDASVGTWSVPDPVREVIYTYSGICEDIGGTDPTPLTTVYGINNMTNNLIGYGISDPMNAEIFGTSPITVNFENAGALDPANPTTGYVLDNGGQFFTFDVSTGFYTALGSIPGDWTGMEFDRTSGILYAIKAESLYIIDPIGISATLVGAFGVPSNALTVSLAIDGAGVGYVHELADDLLYSVNLATGAATAIGATGFDANFGQGMCYDPTTDAVYMSAFNNTTFLAEWRSVNTTTGMTTLVGPIIMTGGAATQVAWSSIGGTLNPPTCPKPTFLAVTDITETTAALSWVAEPNASNGYIWYVFESGADPMTATPVATGTTPAGTTNAIATGLENAISYDFYVVADCSTDGLSTYAGPVTFSTLVTPPACGGKFYDTGGPDGNYDNNENVTTVISPDNAGDFVTVTFTMFNVEATWDALYVYDGPSASSPIISSGNPATNSGFPAGGYYGTNIPGPFSSTHESGALTFVFRSEGSFTYAGWEADVTCAMYPPPNDKIVNSINVGDIGFPYTDPAVRMPAATPENGNPEDCDLTGAYGVWYHFTTVGEGMANANIVTPGGASNVTFFTAPNETAVETDLVRVQQSSNPCNPGTSSTITTVANQTYYVFVMNSGAVTDIKIDVTVLGVSDNALEGFVYYPNPTSGILNLNSRNTIEMVTIYNLLGQKVLDSSLNATSASLDISTLSTGTYVMKVTVNGQTGTYKLLKQ